MERQCSLEKCRVCAGPAGAFGPRIQILRRYDIRYFMCESCGLVQTEEPYWLDEAYSEAIAPSDVGIVSRNVSLVPITSLVIRAFFSSSGRFVDYGAGTGLLVRSMRDRGYDFHYLDAYAQNLFARGFGPKAATTIS